MASQVIICDGRWKCGEKNWHKNPISDKSHKSAVAMASAQFSRCVFPENVYDGKPAKRNTNARNKTKLTLTQSHQNYNNSFKAMLATFFSTPRLPHWQICNKFVFVANINTNWQQIQIPKLL